MTGGAATGSSCSDPHSNFPEVKEKLVGEHHNEIKGCTSNQLGGGDASGWRGVGGSKGMVKWSRDVCFSVKECCFSGALVGSSLFTAILLTSNGIEPICG